MNAFQIVPGLAASLNLVTTILSQDSTAETIAGAADILGNIIHDLTPAALTYHQMGFNDSQAIAEHRAKS